MTGTRCTTPARRTKRALGFSITIKDGKITKRKAFRITVDGLAAFIPRLGKTFPVSDISASGLGFRFQKPRIKCGVKIKMDLLINGGREVEGVLCKVMRHERGVVGCAFVELDRKQEDAVSRIVLEGEKAVGRPPDRRQKTEGPGLGSGPFAQFLYICVEIVGLARPVVLGIQKRGHEEDRAQTQCGAGAHGKLLQPPGHAVRLIIGQPLHQDPGVLGHSGQELGLLSPDRPERRSARRRPWRSPRRPRCASRRR